MTATVTAAELQRDFGLWHDRSMKEPVRITKQGRETAYLVSAETFQQLWSNFRRVVAVEDLTADEMAMIVAADVPDEYADGASGAEGRQTPSSSETETDRGT